MNISITSFLEIAGFLVTIGGLVWSIAYNNGKRDSLETNVGKTLDGFSQQLEKIWKWKDNNEEAAGRQRMDQQKQMAVIESKIAVHDNQYTEITKYLSQINDKMDRMEKRLDSLHHTN